METLGTKNVLTLNEACSFTGLSKNYIYKLTSKRKIPHSKPFGKMVYFERKKLEDWLLQNRVEAVTESEAKAIDHCKTGGLK